MANKIDISATLSGSNASEMSPDDSDSDLLESQAMQAEKGANPEQLESDASSSSDDGSHGSASAKTSDNDAVASSSNGTDKEPSSDSSSASSETSSKSSEESSASSAVDSQASSQTSALASESSSVDRKREEAWRPNLDDKYDPRPMMHIEKANAKVQSYVNHAEQDFSQRPSEKVFNEHLQLLSDAQFEMSTAIEAFLDEYHHSADTLMKRENVLDSELSETKKFNPQSQINMLIKMARTGVPTKIEEIYQRFAWVANDPRFKAWLRQNHMDKDQLKPPKPVLSREKKLEKEHSVIVNRALAKKNAKKGGSK